MVEVPAVVRSKALVTGAGAWLGRLDDLIAELAEAWELRIGEVLPGGTEALVLAVERGEGSPAVLKLLVPRGEAARHEIAVLRHADGDGCARLLEADEGRGALLVERLGPSMHDLGIGYGERLDALADLARRVWRPADDLGLPTGAEKAAWLAEHITTTWEALDRPCPERVIDDAVACAERRREAHDDERAVLVHGDVHQWNALRRDDGWALVDPDGLRAEPEYDIGVLLREDPVELLAAGPRAVAARLADRCGVDAEASWEWGIVERVSTGLLCERIGLERVGRQMLRAAEAVAPAPPPWPAPARDIDSEVRLRPALADDRAFLERMLAAAADWRPEVPPAPIEEVLAEPAFAHYVEGWPAAGDVGVIAEDGTGRPLGAAWCRLLPEDDPGYGFVAAEVPEITIGVVAEARRRGIGRQLLVALADAARSAGHTRISLSVELANPAMALYGDVGFVVVDHDDGAATMVLDLG